MNNQLEIVNPKEFGIEEKQAKDLTANLPAIVEERTVLEKQFSEVIKLDIEEEETVKKARELRLLIQKNRTKGIMTWHRNAKDYFLKGGQFVDAIKKKQIDINQRMENDLMEIEKHAEIKEQKRLQELQEKRVKELSKYVEDAGERNLSNMDDDVWDAYLGTKKQAYLDRIEAEKQAEKERIEREKAEQAEQERIRKENEKLKKEAEEREKKAKLEAEKREKEEKERQAKAEAERREREEKERKEREAHEAQLAKERAEREKMQKELESKAEAERKAKEKEERQKQLELKKGDSDKVNDLINDLKSLKTKYTFKSKEFQKKYTDTSFLIDKVINHIEK